MATLWLSLHHYDLANTPLPRCWSNSYSPRYNSPLPVWWPITQPLEQIY
jgi:hypothetical protein